MPPGDGTRNKEQSNVMSINESVIFGIRRDREERGKEKRGIIKNVVKI